jgi:hypothetical protein
MKKIFIIIFILLLVTGCKQEKFYLEDKYYENNILIEPLVEEVNELFENKESFAAFIYTPGCTSCAEFEKVTDAFRDEHNIIFYHISSQVAKETKIHDKVIYSPSAVLVKEGEIIAYLDATSDKDLEYYKSKENFKSWLEKYIYLNGKVKKE